MFAYRKNLIDHMYRTQEVMSNTADSALAAKLKSWHAQVGKLFLQSFPPLTQPTNVDTNDSDQSRVNAMWNTLGWVTSDYDANGTPDNTRQFMLYIAWHESLHLTKTIQQENDGSDGPARSYFQIQGASARTAYGSSSLTAGRLNTLAGYTGQTVDAISGAFESLDSSPYFPSGNLIGQLLVSSDIFAAYVARSLLWSFPAALPQPATPPVALYQPEADYWFTYWHGGIGDENALKRQFKDNCAVVAPLIPILSF